MEIRIGNRKDKEKMRVEMVNRKGELQLAMEWRIGNGNKNGKYEK